MGVRAFSCPVYAKSAVCFLTFTSWSTSVLPCAGNLSWLPPVVANQLGRAVAEVLNSLLSSPSSDPTSASTQFSRAGDLLDALRLHPAADQQLLATAVAGPVAGALVGSVQQGNAPPEAASLLASLVKQFGAEVMKATPTGAVPGAGRTTGGVLPQTFGCAHDVQDALDWPSLVKFGSCQIHDMCVLYFLVGKEESLMGARWQCICAEQATGFVGRSCWGRLRLAVQCNSITCFWWEI